MPKYIIKGPAKLAGEISVSGAKNSALKIIPAAILCEGKTIVSNLPQIEDVKRSLELFVELGGKIKYKNRDTVELDPLSINKNELSAALVGKFRSSIMFVAPMLVRFGEVKFSHPGGCNIGGERSIDLFIDGFEALGAKTEIKNGYYHIKSEELSGGNFFFTKMISVTGTESLMMMAARLTGKTILKNCAMEPEIVALAEYLNSCGARIKGAGTPTMEIDGVEKLIAGNFKIIPDRIETGSFMCLAAATRSEITIKNCEPEHVRVLLETFKKIGVNYEEGKDWIKIKKTEKFSAYDIKTHEYPGFPTDLQSPYTVLMTQANGSCLIHETIYDRRLLYTDLLIHMGANITLCDPHRIVVSGPTKLFGHSVASPDLRAGIALIIAALVAEGETEINNIYQIERGYEKIDERLKALGADIKKIE